MVGAWDDRGVATRRAAIVPLVFALLLAGGYGVRADEPPKPVKPPLPLLLNADAEGHDEALAAWKALAAAERVAEVRAGLRSSDPAIAFAAAVLADPLMLDLDEIHLQWKAFAARDPLALHMPESTWKEAQVEDGAGRLSFGSPDLPSIWRAIAEREPPAQGFYWSGLHRALLTSQVDGLLPLLETAKPTAFRGLLADIVNQAEGDADDEHHAVYVEAFRYGLARLRAEAAKKAIPKRAAIPPPPRKEGLPAEFVELAEASWGEAGRGFDLGGWPDDPTKKEPRDEKAPPPPPRAAGPARWLARWARRLTPVEDDLEFLSDTVRSPRAPWQAQVWAARRIAAMDGRAAGKAYRDVTSMETEPALYAAAEAASRGRRDEWERLSKSGRIQNDNEKARAPWLVDSRAARAATWEKMLAGKRPMELEESERWFGEYDVAVAVPADALAWLADRLREGKASPAVEAWFFSRVLPGAMTKEDALRIAKRFEEDGKPTDEFDREVTDGFVAIETRAPEAVVSMLRAFASSVSDPKVRRSVLVTLARLGDAALADDMIADWPQWGGNRPLLGRVRDPKVEAFLCERAASSVFETESDAVEAMAIQYGCPDPLAEYLGGASRSEEAPSANHWAEAKALLLGAKDAIGAVLARIADGPFLGGLGLDSFSALGLVRDARVVERMKAWRDDPAAGVRWPATGVLAMLGDDAASAEWWRFLSEARTFLLDDLQDGRLFTRNADSAWVADWVGRLDENCCYAWHADEILSATFPTLPYRHNAGDAGRSRAGAERWFAAHRGTFVWSRLLDGWVPGAKGAGK